MLKAIEKIKPLEIEIICPGHGPILRENWKSCVDKSEQLSREFLEKTGNKSNNVLITYVSAYGYTKSMAYKIKEGLEKAGDFKITVIDIENILLGDLEEQIVKSNALLIGSPTINQNTLLPVFRLFALINPIRDRGKLGLAFGSYGWSGEAVKIIEANMKALKLNVAFEGLTGKFFPHNEKAEEFVEFGKKIADQILSAAPIETE